MAIPQQVSDLPYAGVLVPHDGSLAASGEYDAAHLDGVTADDVDAAGARFLECAFTSVTLSGGTIHGGRFNEVWLHSVRFVGVELAETSWVDATLLSSAWSGVEAFSAKLRRVTFTGCKLDSVNFRAAELTDVVFDNCVLTDVDIGGATLTGVRFPTCTIRGLKASHATMKDVDLRDAAELHLAEGYAALRGATIDSGQLAEIAPALAHTLGIAVDD